MGDFGGIGPEAVIPMEHLEINKETEDEESSVRENEDEVLIDLDNEIDSNENNDERITQNSEEEFKGAGPIDVGFTNLKNEDILPKHSSIDTFESNAIQCANIVLVALVLCIMLSWLKFRKSISHIFAPVSPDGSKPHVEASVDDVIEKKTK